MKNYTLTQRIKVIKDIDYLKQQVGSTDIQYKELYMNINAIELDLTEEIYRIFDFEYFKNDLIDKKLTLVRPHIWEDPFENFLLQSKGVLPDGTEVKFETIRDSFYCQCWSLREECDGLWRNYKGQKDFAIKVKTNTKKLFNAFYAINDPLHYLSYFIGLVDYITNDEIEDFFKTTLNVLDFKNGVEFASTLLKKRKSYSYEEEVRLIMYSHFPNKLNILRVNLDLNDIIDEIVFDPWITPELYAEKKQEIIDLGYNGVISRSSLYDKPFFKVKIS